MNTAVADKSQKVKILSKPFNVVQEELIDLAQYWRTIRRAKWSILAVTLVCLIIGAFIASSAQPIYRATTKILADPQQPSANGKQQNISTALVFLYYQTQYEIINSRNLAETVVDKLGLVEKYKKTQQENKNKEVSELTRRANNLKSNFTALFPKDFSTYFPKELTGLFPNDNNLKKSPPSDADLKIMLATRIQAAIKVSGGKKSQIINISYISTDPEEATIIINAISDAYIQFGLASRLSEVKNTESWLGEQSILLTDKLQTSEKKLTAYRLQQGLVDTVQQQHISNTQLQSLNSELIRAQTNLSAAEEQYFSVKDVPHGSKEFYSLGPVLQNKTASDMVKAEASASQRVSELTERYGDKHPKMISARSELKSSQSNLAREVNKIVDNIQKNYKLAQFQVSNINNLIRKNRAETQSSQTENFSLVRLEREVENNRRIYENFQMSLMEASGRGAYTASNVHIIDRAIVPKAPFKPNIKLIIVFAGLFGVFFGIVLTFMRETLNNTFKTPDAIENKIKIPALGIIPVVKKKKNIAIPEKQYLDDPLSPFSESINTIRTGLLFSNIDQPPKTILVTSATGSEGKSTMAINLAFAYSNLGKTLLLEVDLRQPSINLSLGLNSKLGLTDLVTGSVESMTDVYNRDNDNKLSIITCGTLSKNPLELLSSQKFDLLLASLKSHFDYIILDGPPTLPVSDSCILANKVDGVIFAIKAEYTQIKVAKEAVSRLQKLNANIIGAVLTEAEPQKMSYYGDHFYSGEFYGTKTV